MRSGGMGLGLDRGSLFNRTLEVERIQLHPGDIIALFTDGLVEARSAEGDEYGYDRCLAVLLRNRHEDASGIKRALMDDINRYRDASERYGDDLTLVILKWHGASAEPVAS